MKGGGGQRGRGIFGQVTVMPTTNGFFYESGREKRKRWGSGTLIKLSFYVYKVDLRQVS
jgi:hypothetical protein